MATEAQLRASKKYQDKHKEDVKFNTKKSHAKWFIKNSDISRLDDLKELREGSVAKFSQKSILV